MDYTALVDKFARESEMLRAQLNLMPDEPSTARLDLVLSQAKRVRRTSNLVVQALARHRDATAQEGTST